MRINNNIMAQNTHRQYAINNASIAKSTEKLSSGYRINRAGDDAAGLAISEKMRAQIRGLQMASKNSQDAISLVQTAEGALQESHNILQRMRELAVQSASDTNETSIDRGALEQEFQQLINELDDTANKTKFNDMGLIDGSYAQNTTTAKNGTKTDYDMTWASTKTEVGTYLIEHKAVLIQAAVSGVSATYTQGSGSNAINLQANGPAGSALTISFQAPDKLAQSDRINGTWNLGYDSASGFFTATNSRTGEIRVAKSMAVPPSGTATIDFGDLGKFVITNTSASYDVNQSNFNGFSGSVEVKGGVSPKEAAFAHVATLNGEEVRLEAGQKTLVFKNSGISVNLKNAVNPDSISSLPITGVAGTVHVTRTGYNPLVIQTGANQSDQMSISIEKMDAYSLGVRNASIANRADASQSITQVNTAINSVSTQRAALGALQNRLNHKIANLDTSAENLQAAESRIRDIDMAKEMTVFTKNNILFQASTAMLAQANAAPQGVLQLLG